MENSSGKISFGFSKVAKKSNLVKTALESVEIKTKIEKIDSIQGSQVTFEGKDVAEQNKQKLVIPMTSDQKTRPISRLIAARTIKKEVDEIKKELDETRIETLEQRAAREIIEDLQNREIKSEAKILELPIHPDQLPLEGAVESTNDDYERVPISDFGKAMLRGMGWKEQEEKDKIFDVPIVRPKGLGLGADKVVKKQPLLIAPGQNETLEIKRNANVKILAGKHKNLYGTIEGFDDGAGRVIVKLALGGVKIVMNEFMVQPISKQEFAKYGKILNSEKYEEFKNSDTKSNRRSKSVSPTTPSAHSSRRNQDRKSRSLEREKNRDRDEERPNHQRSSKRDDRKEDDRRDKRYQSSDSEDDKTNNRKYNERRHRSRSNDRPRKRYSSSDSNSDHHHHSSRKKSNKKHSKSSKKSSNNYSSDDERKHKRKYKRSKHHRDRS